jgi:hypothetical protein
VKRDKNRAGKGDKPSKHAASSRPAQIAAAPRSDGAHARPLRSWKPTSRIAVFPAIAAFAIGGLAFVFVNEGRFSLPGALRSSSPAPTPAFVGSEACAGCHQPETALWKESQHRHAMQRATATSVLSNFDDAGFDYFGVHSRFFKEDNKFFVETDGPDSKLATFQVKYTFGIDPLQQYLIEFPDGRIQALSIAWDSRPKEQGGQRWFHLYPNEEIKHDDVLHWTKLNQN